jgi:hypothetical protein
LPTGALTKQGNAHNGRDQFSRAFGGRNGAPFAYPEFTTGLEFMAECAMPDADSSWQ